MGKSCGEWRLQKLGAEAVFMKILLTGKNGQVGFELTKKLLLLGEVIAVGREELNLLSTDAIRIFLDKIKPDIIINPAAYTAVDKAESEIRLAHQINSIAPRVLAEKAADLDIPLVHFSTDYVFDGIKKDSYLENDQTNPQSAYGITKCEGEESVRLYNKHIILRTSWVFGNHGGNFLKTILRLIHEKESLSVVSDQWGSPTSSSTLADVTFKIVDIIFNNKKFNNFGTYHVTNSGETNWHQYACFIANEAAQLGFKIKCKADHIHPILTSEYLTAAKRPLNSRLNTDKLKKTFMLELPQWESEVNKVLRGLI